MPDFRTLYDRHYLYAYDLQNRDVTVSIKAVKAGRIKNKEQKEERKPILFFKESKDERGMVSCITNSRTIATLYGPNTDDWIGKRITLFSAMVDAFGKTVEAIRIRPTIPAAKTKPGEFSEVELRPAPEAPEQAEMGEREPGSDG